MSLIAAIARKIYTKAPCGSVPLIKVTNDFWLERNDPACPIIIINYKAQHGFVLAAHLTPKPGQQQVHIILLNIGTFIHV
jgi:hypothetical protein